MYILVPTHINAMVIQRIENPSTYQYTTENAKPLLIGVSYS